MTDELFQRQVVYKNDCHCHCHSCPGLFSVKASGWHLSSSHLSEPAFYQDVQERKASEDLFSGLSKSLQVLVPAVLSSRLSLDPTAFLTPFWPKQTVFRISVIWTDFPSFLDLYITELYAEQFKKVNEESSPQLVSSWGTGKAGRSETRSVITSQWKVRTIVGSCLQ